jgi:glycosyltransferase involved in cell wall biosynthesis
VRPRKIWEEFQRTWQEMRVLPHILTITASRFLKEQMVFSGYPGEMIEVMRVPPQFVQASLPPRSQPPQFLYLGRIDATKGLAWMLRAVAGVRGAACFDVLGDGPLLPQMKALAESLGVSKRVTFHGWVGTPEVIQRLEQCRALILPSVWHEPGATVVVEAMAVGRAVIVSRVGGMPEVVPDERNGILVTPNDEAGLSRAIERLAGDWELAARMGQEGRRLVEEHYTLARHVEMLTAVYDRVREREFQECRAPL